MHRVVAIIPARYKSTRFPGKPLADLNGKILIHHVFDRVSAANLVDHIIIATDDQRIFDAVTNFGGSAVMTSGSHKSGTDRIAEVAGKMKCEIVVNVQGDEPFIRPEMIDDVVRLLYNDDGASISTLAKKTSDINEIMSPNVVKVVTDEEGYALYFSRSPIPYYRDRWNMVRDGEANSYKLSFDLTRDQEPFCYKHIGIYGYRKSALMTFSSMPPGRLENTEMLEQLRAMAAGMKIKVKETEHETYGIDTPEDLRKAEKWQSTSL